jgi:UDP-N-acetylmuramate dehydrogenase
MMACEDTADTTIPRNKLISAFGQNLEISKDLSQYTSFNTGGKARYFIAVHSVEEIVRTVKASNQLSIPFFILGGGSNLLISDSGFDGLVIRIEVTGIELVNPNTISCGAGENLMNLINFATGKSLTGLEFAAGIWGTVGGAIYGNAGAYGGDIGTHITELTLVDSNALVKTVPSSYCRFGYRDSYLKVTHEIIVNAKMALQPGKREGIEQKINEILTLRLGKHPVTRGSAGCFFKNIPDPKEPHGKLPAGRLLDEVGAKGLSVGGAKVFDKHANIIVNTGNATSKDIRQLADILKQKVFERFGVNLEEEVVQIGNF